MNIKRLAVPFGFVFASYVCTEKLLTKLLPTTSLTIDHTKAWPNGENEVTYATDKEGREDMGDWIEMSIALADNDDDTDLKYGQSQQEKLFSEDQFTSYKEGHEYDELTKQSGEGEEPSSNIIAQETVVARDAMSIEEITVDVRNKEDKKTEERNNVPVERSSNQGRPGVDVENVDFAEDEGKKNVNGRNEIQHDVEDKNTKMDKVVMGMKGI